MKAGRSVHGEFHSQEDQSLPGHIASVKRIFFLAAPGTFVIHPGPINTGCRQLLFLRRIGMIQLDLKLLRINLHLIKKRR